MKIYKPKQPFLIRVNIRKQGEKTEHITFCETTIEELKPILKEIIQKELINPFVGGKKTAIDLRESDNSKNGRSESFSFIGLSPKQVKNIILNYFNERK